ncbi:MAG: nicotinate-nucleotide diphosphorylase (carboxylating), partial [Anaerolineaceae bacterium]
MSDNAPFSSEVLAHIRLALNEDIGTGDVTTDSIVPQDAVMKGQIIAKQNGVVAGLDVARCVYQMLDPRVEVETCVEEGARVENRQLLARVTGPARALLTGERTALNYLGRMSGIATLTHQFAVAVAGTRAV